VEDVSAGTAVVVLGEEAGAAVEYIYIFIQAKQK
jgi:hypothetical protein